MTEKARDNQAEDVDPIVEFSSLAGGATGYMVAAAKRQGPLVLMLSLIISGGSLGVYNAVQWVGTSLLTPIADQHVKTLQIMQSQALEHSATLRSIEKSLDNAIREHSNKLELIHLEIKRMSHHVETAK